MPKYSHVDRIRHILITKPKKAIQDFLNLETASSILLLFGACLALIMSNIDFLSDLYHEFLETNITVHIHGIGFSDSIHHWINDGLMAIFFLVVSLELKREMIEGQLSNLRQVLLPIIAAIGGMVVPACIYLAINWANPETILGWAIPSATDIAFSLGVLSLLGSRVSLSLKLFLMTLAIIDDLGAILIIILFYSAENIELNALYYAAGILAIMGFFNLIRISTLSIYLICSVFLWFAMLKSGIHATLAGVMLAFFIPLYDQENECSPLRILESNLHPMVAYIIMPLFAFSNAGIEFTHLSWHVLFDTMPLGIILGLLVGKQLGVMLFSWGTIRLGWAQLPDEQLGWGGLYGIAVLCGIGFTMSLFIGTLAFEEETALMNQVRVGVLLGSLLSAVIGYSILHYVTAKNYGKLS